jgi:anaerobic selenocysteine-containing dehydrogenase
MDIHPETAAQLNLKNDDWAWIENPRGRVLHRARITHEIDRRVVSCEPGWWYPEKKDDLFGVWFSNINLLCSMDGPYDPVQGTSTLRTMLCSVRKAEPDEVPLELKHMK